MLSPILYYTTAAVDPLPRRQHSVCQVAHFHAQGRIRDFGKGLTPPAKSAPGARFNPSL